MSPMRQLSVLLCLVMLAAGCASALRPESPQPAFYQIDYQSKPADCPQSFEGGVRVWNFTAAPPYDRTQMVVLGPDREVIFSRNYQWAALPGDMLTRRVRDDLEAGRLFPGGVVEAGLEAVPWELSGRIGKFACQRTDGSCRAVLEVDVTLNRTAPGAQESFKESYRFESDPFAKEDSALFAAAMSRLAGRFSEQLRRDLCRFAGEVPP